MATTNSPEYELVQRLLADFVEAGRQGNAPALVASIMEPGEGQRFAAATVYGPSTAILSMLTGLILRLMPSDFAMLLEALQTSPIFELHRNPPKEGMVN
jgi:hypothetical protein